MIVDETDAETFFPFQQFPRSAVPNSAARRLCVKHSIEKLRSARNADPIVSTELSYGAQTLAPPEAKFPHPTTPETKPVES
jgi:hypothetical protein